MEISKALEAISNDKSQFIGEGKWYKDSAYQVHKVGEAFYVITVCDSQNREILDDSIQRIGEEDIKDYI